MRIGLVSQILPYLPSKEGFRVYGGNLIRCLSKRHDIDLVSLMAREDEPHLDWAKQYCASVTAVPMEQSALMVPVSLLSAHLFGRPLQQRRALARGLAQARRSWDLVHVEGGYVGGIVPDGLAGPRILSLHDSWTLRCEEMIRCAVTRRERMYYQVLRHHEPRFQRLIYPRYDRCVVVAERDRAAVQATVPAARVEVIPYGIDLERFRPPERRPAAPVLIFHGNMSYAPNVAATLAFADEIFPRVRAQHPDAVFHVVAADPVASVEALAARPGLRLSRNLVDVRPALAEAAVYVCALRHGTGMKNKMLEAMAMGLPIVCYEDAVSGIDAVSGRHLLVARDAEQFALIVGSLLGAPARGEALGAAARKLMELRYGWEAVASAFEDLYDRVRRERPKGPAARSGAARRPEELSA
jgi:glycosyltransferase involved in cell wall biosynthesis